jgi:hypothetical protein
VRISSQISELHESAAGSIETSAGAVLPPEVAARLFVQCSRPAPKITGIFWKPSPEHIARLEADFPQFYGRSVEVRSGQLDYYDRQYVGFFAPDGRRLIYANFFPTVIPSQELQAQDPVRWDQNRWKKEPMIICDGSARYFGIVFDPLTASFSEYETNGF